MPTSFHEALDRARRTQRGGDGPLLGGRTLLECQDARCTVDRFAAIINERHDAELPPLRCPGCGQPAVLLGVHTMDERLQGQLAAAHIMRQVVEWREQHPEATPKDVPDELLDRFGLIATTWL